MTHRTIVALAIVLALVAAVYAIALPGPFQFDDYATVAVDPGAQSLAAWWENAGHHVRPLAKASFAVSHTIGEWVGNVPLGHRLANVLIHLGAVLALFLLGRRLVATCVSGLDEQVALRAAFAAAALFGLHPFATEAVSYISGRSMSLGVLFSSISFYAYIRARSGECRAVWLGAAVIACAVALFTREATIITPLLWLLWEFARRDLDTPAFSTRRLRQIAPLLAWPVAISILFASWLAWHARYSRLLEMSWTIASWRPGEPTLVVALEYFASSFLLLRYPNIDPLVSPHLLSPGARIAAGVLIACVALLAWRWRNARPHVLLGLAWVLAWLAPVYLFQVRHDPIAERHFYPAIWGAALPLAVEWAKWAVKLSSRRALANAILVAAISLLSVVTLVRNADYRSEVALWEAAQRGAPDKLRVLNNLGVAYMEVGRWQDAERVLARAIELDPGYERARRNLRAAQDRKLEPGPPARGQQ